MITINPVKRTARLHEELKAYRKSQEAAGVVYPPRGKRFHTDTDSRVVWLRMKGEALADPDFVEPAFKAMDGWVLNLTADEIIEIEALGASHVRACFGAEAAVGSALDALESVAEVQAAFDAAYAAAGGPNG
jgi:hypothetical protein